MECFDVIHDSPSQIYHSALPLSPSSCWFHKCYGAEFSQEVKVVGGIPAEWGTCCRTVTLKNTPLSLACWKDIIAVGLGSGDITILDGITGTQSAVLSGHTNWVRSVVFSSDGTLLVSGSSDYTIKLWDVQTGGVVNTFHGHAKWVHSVSLSADYTMIASGSEDKTIHLWNIQTRESHKIIEQQEQVAHVIFSPTNPQHLMSISDGKVWKWGLNGHQTSPPYDGSCVAFSSDGTQFVLCRGREVEVQNCDTQVIVAKFHIANSDPSHCCFSPDGRLIAIATRSTICVCDITNSNHPHTIETFVGHTNNITCLAFSSPSSLISSSYDKSVKFWQISTSPTNPAVTDPKSTTLASAPIRSITLQAKDGIAFSCNGDGVVRTWDISTGCCIRSFQTPVKYYNGRDIQLINNRLIFVWQVGEKLHIWDVEKGEPIQIVDIPGKDIEDVKMSGDGLKVFCLHYQSIQAWSILTGEGVGEVELKYSKHRRFLAVDGSQVWVHSPELESQGWDFRTPNPSPAQLSDISSPHLNDTMVWDVNLSGIKDTVSGKVVFQLGGRFAKPVDSQWDSGYLVAGYRSGEVLILDFNHMLSNRDL